MLIQLVCGDCATCIVGARIEPKCGTGISTSFGIGVFLKNTLAAATFSWLCHLLRDLFWHQLTHGLPH